MWIFKINIKYLFFIFLFLPTFAFSQWDLVEVNVNFSLPQIALIDIEPDENNNIHFLVLPDAESGNPALTQLTTGQSLWINYSSSRQGLQNSRSITATIGQGTVPPGMAIFIQTSTHSNTGKGQRGQPTGKVEITYQPKPIITNIGNSFTGDGINNGHQLTFSMEITDYTKISSTNIAEFTILYTLTDN